MWYWQGIFGGLFLHLAFFPQLNIILSTNRLETLLMWTHVKVILKIPEQQVSAIPRRVLQCFSHPIPSRVEYLPLEKQASTSSLKWGNTQEDIEGLQTQVWTHRCPWLSQPLGGRTGTEQLSHGHCAPQSHSDIAIPSRALGWRAELAVWAQQCCSSSFKCRLFSC